MMLASRACRRPGCSSPSKRQQPSPLTLQQAVNIALEKNPQRKAALADTKAASADVKEARSFLLPHVTFSETATRGDDPVYVFGSKLRQQRFTTADFALNILNTPAPFGNFATRFGGTWNLFDSFASWRAVNRAERVKDAAGHQLERTDQEIVFRVVDSYYGVLLARKQLEVAEQSDENGAGHSRSQQGSLRKRRRRGIRLPERAGAHGDAKAGTDPRAKRSGTGAGTTEHRDGPLRGERIRSSRGSRGKKSPGDVA